MQLSYHLKSFKFLCLNWSHYKGIIISKIMLHVNGKDSCFKTCNGKVVVLHNIVYSNDNIVSLVGNCFQEKAIPLTFLCIPCSLLNWEYLKCPILVQLDVFLKLLTLLLNVGLCQMEIRFAVCHSCTHDNNKNFYSRCNLVCILLLFLVLFVVLKLFYNNNIEDELEENIFY